MYQVGDKVVLFTQAGGVPGVVRVVRSDGLLWIEWTDKRASYVCSTNLRLALTGEERE